MGHFKIDVRGAEEKKQPMKQNAYGLNDVRIFRTVYYGLLFICFFVCFLGFEYKSIWLLNSMQLRMAWEEKAMEKKSKKEIWKKERFKVRQWT